MTNPALKITWAVLWMIVIISAALYMSAESNAADVWTVHSHGPHTTIVGPNGQRHTIIDNTPPSYGYYGNQQGWNQYPNPVDAFFQNYRRGAAFNNWIRSGR